MLITIVAIFPFINLISSLYTFNNVSKCFPNDESPTLIALRTRLNVFYDGSQWFHMAENYLVQHSLLQANQRLVSQKSVVYSFDSGIEKDIFGFVTFFSCLIF